KLVVEHDQVAVPTADDCLRHHRLHFLRDHANVGLVAAIVAEPIEAQAIVEITEQRDVMFEHGIGPSAATASAATTTPSAASAHARAAAATAHTRWPWNACPGASCTLPARALWLLRARCPAPAFCR